MAQVSIRQGAYAQAADYAARAEKARRAAHRGRPQAARSQPARREMTDGARDPDALAAGAPLALLLPASCALAGQAAETGGRARGRSSPT